MSTPINPEFVERYQNEYEKNPNSRVFAPLAEAYRRMGLIEEALQVCAHGVEVHPQFASGRVAYAKVLLEQDRFDEALKQLDMAIQISPDNLMAHSLRGETLIKLRKPKEALKAFKMVLYLHPEDERALSAVQKWEFLTADEYESDLFSVKPQFEATSNSKTPESKIQMRKEIERALSLADAFTVRNDIERAIEVLERARKQLGAVAEIENRLNMLIERARPEPSASTASIERIRREAKETKLQTLLQRISERRLES